LVLVVGSHANDSKLMLELLKFDLKY